MRRQTVGMWRVADEGISRSARICSASGIVVVVLGLSSVLALHGGRVIWIVENEQQAAPFFVFVLGGASSDRHSVSINGHSVSTRRPKGLTFCLLAQHLLQAVDTCSPSS